MNVKNIIGTVAITTAGIGALYTASNIKTGDNAEEVQVKNTSTPYDPIKSPITAGTLFTLGLFGKRKDENDILKNDITKALTQVLKEERQNRSTQENLRRKEEEKLKSDTEKAQNAGMSLEKYRSLFKPISKSDYKTIHSFYDGNNAYFNTAKEWLFAWDENYEPDIQSIKEGLEIMDSCFKQYEKENIKIFEEKDKLRCKQLMEEISAAIEKGKEIEDSKIDELVLIYDRKRLYPYI